MNETILICVLVGLGAAIGLLASYTNYVHSIFRIQRTYTKKRFELQQEHTNKQVDLLMDYVTKGKSRAGDTHGR